MIGLIEGIVYEKVTSHKVLVKTHAGIGYEVSTLLDYPIGAHVSLYISHIFREQGQELFGFHLKYEKLYFELLLQVKGVGPKTAFQIQRHLTSEQMYQAISKEDESFIKGVPGVGRKTAGQIILDLKQHLSTLKTWWNIGQQSVETISPEINYTLAKDALLQMGVDAKKISVLIKKCVEKYPGIRGTEQLIKTVLQEMP
jgi:Holliday junction DNA helicase RuvA